MSRSRATRQAPDAALYDAAVRGDIEVLQSAWLAGGDPDAVGGGQRIPALTASILAGQRESAVFLLQHGADPDKPDGKGYPPLSVVLRQGRQGYLGLLLDYGADPDRRRIAHSPALERISPLELAVREGDEPSARLLLDAGADPLSVEPSSGRQARNFARGPAAGQLRDCLDPYEDMPRVETGPGLRKAHLFAIGADGRMPLENPVTWRRLPAIVERLERNGERFGKADLLRENTLGVPLLLQAIDTRMLGYALSVLNRHGENLLPTELRGNPCLEHALGDTYVLRMLFGKENLRPTGVEGLRASLRVLPKELQGILPDRFRLAAELAAEGSRRQRGR